jgi:hypothetical protein
MSWYILGHERLPTSNGFLDALELHVYKWKGLFDSPILFMVFGFNFDELIICHDGFNFVWILNHLLLAFGFQF